MSRTMFAHAERLKRIIKIHQRIHKFDLIVESKISISLYEKIKPWIEYKFSDFVRYERSSKEWVWIADEGEDYVE